MSNALKPSKTIDCVGLYCPQPLFQTREAMDELESGEILEVLADDPGAESDLNSFARRTGNQIVLTERLSEGVMRFLIEKE
ncbi:MAG: sulfurtransferase TusA family protein [Candidatus Thorarchaeota archaeon]